MVAGRNDGGQTLEQYLTRAAWKQQLDSEYQQTSARITQGYSRLLRGLQGDITALTSAIADTHAANDGLQPKDVTRLRELDALKSRIENELTLFGGQVVSESASSETAARALGIEAAADMINAQSRGVLASALNRPDPRAIEIAGMYADSPAFRANWSAFGTNAAQAFADFLVTGVAQGKNPRTIARLISKWLAVPLAWALNAVSTAQLWGYRSSSHETYQRNPRVLDGWMWIATLDGRVCMCCLNQHGTIHKLEEKLNGHHRCRCTPVPIIKGAEWPKTIKSGRDWFAEQAPDVQKGIAGGALLNALNAGAITWEQMSQPYQNDVYGEMLRQPSLISLLGEEAPQYYD